MAKKSKKVKKQGAAKAADPPKPLVTMADLEAMSDSDDDSALPPEEEWDADAKALKKAIEDGAFDQAMKEYKKGGDDDSIEEVALDDDDDEEDEGDDGQAEEAQAASEEEDESDEYESDQDHKEAAVDMEEEIDDEEEESDDESDVKAKLATKPQHKQDSSARAKADGTAASDDDNKPNDQEDDNESDSEDEHGGKKRIADENVNSKAIRVVTEDLAAARSAMPWAESFTIVPPTSSPFATGAESSLDIHDDLKREVAFYDLALEAALEARKKCQDQKIAFSRPEDFFAEMVKTDEHMARIKDRLIFENKKMEAVAQRKSNKEQKLRAKEAQSNKLAEKAKRKKDHYQAVQEWAQTAASQRGGAVNEKADEAFLRNMKKGPSKKRQAADRKYGFGGKRGRFKKTDPNALNDMSAYNKRGNFEGGKKKTTSASASKRPGKRARDAGRSRR